MGDKTKELRAVVLMQVIEVDAERYGVNGPDRIWTQRQMAVPLQRIAAFDFNEVLGQMVKEAIDMTYQEPEPEPKKK